VKTTEIIYSVPLGTGLGDTALGGCYKGYFVCHFCLETLISNWKFVLFVLYQLRPFLLSVTFGTEIAGCVVKLACVCA